jgi:hypothetical protein
MPSPTRPPRAGRGATINATPQRFNLKEREEDGDWLDAREQVDGLETTVRTTVTVEKPRTIITRNAVARCGFRSVDQPLSGLRTWLHLLLRATDPRLSRSITRPRFRDSAVRQARCARICCARNSCTQLCRPGRSPSVPTPIDYQPIESHWKITLACHRDSGRMPPPVHDHDQIGSRRTRSRHHRADGGQGAGRGVPLGTDDRSEDGKDARTACAAPGQATGRGQTTRCRRVPVYVSIAPVVPQITDHEMEHIVAAAAGAGARGLFFLPVRLPHEVAPLFRAWLEAHYPDRAAKVMATIQSIRGGRDNDPDFFTRMKGQGPWADLLSTRFRIACAKHGLTRERLKLRTDLFQPPAGDQLQLF